MIRRGILMAICAVALGGCTQPDANVEPRDHRHVLSRSELAEVGRALDKLEVGMSFKKVWAILNRTAFSMRPYPGIGGGPVDRSYTQFQLGPDAGVTLRFDHTREPPTLVSVERGGSAWPPKGTK